LLSFYQKGCTLEGLLELWPLLRGEHRPKLPMSVARGVCEKVFDECQSNKLSAVKKFLRESEREDWGEVARVVDLLLDAGLEEAEAPLEKTLAGFFRQCGRFSLGEIPGRATLEEFARREKNPLPRAAVFLMLGEFLPSRSAVAGRAGFARVTLTTRHRAEGAMWSHLVFAESNAGVWPRRREASCWLPDEARRALNESGRTELALLTTEDRARLEKCGYAALARDTSGGIVFSAALHDELDSEMKLAPNAWAERAGWHVFAQRGGKASELDGAFRELARAATALGDLRIGTASESGVAASLCRRTPKIEDVARWLDVWRGRRDAGRAFDEFFFCVTPDSAAQPRIGSLAAREIEAGVRDPASLWFDKVLRAGRVEWGAFERSRRKNLGTLAHRVLARALRGDQARGNFQQMPAEGDARAAVSGALRALRAQWPADCYWDSFHAELCFVCEALLGKIYHQLNDGGHEPGEFVATELHLPRGARVPLDEGGEMTLPVTGFIDLLRLDRPAIEGADVDVVDFKTGKGVTYSVKSMGRSGALLQLGVYLAALKSLGAADGRVWVARPDAGEARCIHMADAQVREGGALACLRQIGRHVTSGQFGALTEEPSEFSDAGVKWPVACVPIALKDLKKKFAVTFGAGEAQGEGGESEVGDE